jgi:CBS domain containing-hemolysin-like protein
MDSTILWLVILLLLSGFFSSSELAFVVSNKIKLELRARKNNLAAKNAVYYIHKPHYFFSTILIMNNVINIAFASLITVFLSFSLGWTDFQILLISSGLLLLFGELIPKYLAREFSDSFILLAIIPIRLVNFITYPLVLLTSSISSLFNKTSGFKEEKMSYLFDREDFKFLLSEGIEAGSVGEVESDIIGKVIELRDQKVYEVMTPRTDIVGIEINSSIDEALKIFIESGYTKLPVYEENLDNIKGLIFAYDIFKLPESFTEMVRETEFIPDTKKTLEMLNEFLDKQISIAVVIDEFGGTAGILTVEDIIEEILGEIKDEYDVEENICRKIDKWTYVMSGKIEIDYLNEEYQIMLPEGDYETIGGYVTSFLGRIPDKGEIITLGHIKAVILRSTNTKVELMKIYVDPEKYEELTL